MRIVANEQLKDAIEWTCKYASEYKVDIDIHIDADGEISVSVCPTYRDTADTPQTDLVKYSDDLVKDLVKDTPQTECDTCRHYKPACELFSEICKYEPTTQTETENSNLTFEKVMEEIQTQVIEFPDTHQKFTFARKIEMDGDSIKIGGWEYKGVKDAERFVKGSEQTERSE